MIYIWREKRVDIPRAMGARKSAMRKGMAEAMGATAARATRAPVTFIATAGGFLCFVVLKVFFFSFSLLDPR